jgi:hypothetical protein
VAGIVEKSKNFAEGLQRRSDETFQDINASPSKTGNPEDALRPDLQENPLADKVGVGLGAGLCMRERGLCVRRVEGFRGGQGV